MDRLTDIPIKDTPMTTEEAKIIETFFGDGTGINTIEEEKLSWKKTFKIAIYSGIVFATLANPWINIILARFPYITSNPIMIFVLKIFLFVIITMMIIKFIM